jgi:hypothetical protein
MGVPPGGSPISCNSARMAARAARCSAICRPSRESSRKPLVSGDYGNFALFSCFANGELAAAIAAVNKDGGNFAITPLLVSVRPR